MDKKNSNKLYRSLIRAIRTMTEAAAAVILIEISLGHGLTCIVWSYLLSVVSMAGVLSFLSLYFLGSPKNYLAIKDGELLIDRSGETDIYRLELGIDFEKLAEKDRVIFEVKDNIKLPDA